MNVEQVDYVVEMPIDLTIKSSNQEEKFYEPSLGKSVQYYQPNPPLVKEQVIEDSVVAFKGYPFQLNPTSTLKQLKCKLNNVHLEITEDKIRSDKPILIETVNDCLHIWNYSCSENRVLTSTGDSRINGYRLLNFNGESIKVEYSYEILEWSMYSADLSSISFSGNATYHLSRDLLGTNLQIKSLGKNNLQLDTAKFILLQLAWTYGDVSLNDSTINQLFLKVEGNASITDLIVNSAKVKLVGDGQIQLRKQEETSSIEIEKFGTGSVIIL